MTEAHEFDYLTPKIEPEASPTEVTAQATLAAISVLPGENPADKEQLRIELISELAPKTAYQRRLAQQLVEYEWEIDRHRRLRDLSLAGQYQKRAQDLLQQRIPSKAFEKKELSENDLFIARDLVSPIEAERVEAEKDLVNETFWEPKHVFAMAAGTCPSANAHEARIRDLERRRATLRKDLEALKKTSVAPIEDAEIIEADA